MILPFLILWFPSIIMDDVGVIEGLNRGAKVAKESYWLIILAIIISAMPGAIHFLVHLGNFSLHNVQQFNNAIQTNTLSYWILILQNS